MTAPITIVGPMPRDQLSRWTTTSLDRDFTGVPLPLGGLPWPGRLVRAAGTDGQQEQGIFVRTTPGGSATGTEAVFVHGLAGSSTNWTPLAGLMASRATGFAVDLPGCGRSDPPRCGDYSVEEDLRVLTATIRAVARGPVHLVGNSLGGYLATLLAATQPELVRSLTLISPAVPDLRLTADRGADIRLAVLLAPGIGGIVEPRLAGLSAGERVAGMVELCFGDPQVVTPADRAIATQETEWRKDLPWTQRAVVQQLRGLMRGHLQLRDRSFWAAAATVTVPTLVVWGTRDRLVDVRLAKRTTAAFADSELLVLAGVGHVAQMEAPLDTARAMAVLWDAA